MFEPPVILMVMDMQNDFCSRDGVFARKRLQRRSDRGDRS